MDVGALARAVAAPVVGADAAAGGAASSPTARVAVSYTHLRAHETVLDLVCRLLLDKKKNNKETKEKKTQ